MLLLPNHFLKCLVSDKADVIDQQNDQNELHTDPLE